MDIHYFLVICNKCGLRRARDEYIGNYPKSIPCCNSCGSGDLDITSTSITVSTR